MEATAFSTYQQDLQVRQYLGALNALLLMYCFTVRPNLYSFFASMYLVCAMPSSAIWIYFINIVLIALYPVCATFLSGNYILLSMLTYFPYESNRERWQLVCHYTVPPAVLLVTYTIQFISQKSSGSKTLCTGWLSMLRNGGMGRQEPEIPIPNRVQQQAAQQDRGRRDNRGPGQPQEELE